MLWFLDGKKQQSKTKLSSIGLTRVCQAGLKEQLCRIPPRTELTWTALDKFADPCWSCLYYRGGC